MSLNIVTLNGRLPKFDPKYTKGQNGKSYLMWALSVKRDYKPEGAQYYPEDLIRFKAFGPKADFIMNNFAQGDGINIIGKIYLEDDYEKDGQVVKGQYYVQVDTATFPDGKMSSNQSQGGAAKGSAPTAPKANGIPKRPGGIPTPPAGAPKRPGGIPMPPVGR